METLRQRIPFIYPTQPYSTPIDLDLDLDTDPLDEQSQEHLLTSLRNRESESNHLYRLVFTLLPLSVSFPFLWYILTGPIRYGILCILAITSLGITGWQMYIIPIPDDSPGGTTTARDGGGGKRKGRAKPSDVFGGANSTLAKAADLESPLGKALPVLNVVMCAVLVGASYMVKGRKDAPEEFWVWLGLPALMAGICWVVRRAMMDVQRALGGLEGMRFGLKGA